MVCNYYKKLLAVAVPKCFSKVEDDNSALIYPSCLKMRMLFIMLHKKRGQCVRLAISYIEFNKALVPDRCTTDAYENLLEVLKDDFMYTFLQLRTEEMSFKSKVG